MSAHPPLCQKLVVAEYATGGTAFIGECIGYQASPSYLFDVGGERPATWLEDLCREATPEEAIAYWRDRALAAEPTTDRKEARG